MRPKLEGKCVLVAEDDGIIALGLEQLLTSAGANIAGPFGSCADALEFLMLNRPDLAILDIELTDGRSYPVAEQLKAININFVVTSGRVTPDHAMSGAPFFPKPYPEAKLLATLAELVA